MGTLALDGQASACELSAIDPEGVVVSLRQGVGLSNGLGWSPDAAWFYHVDSHLPVITKYPIERDGTLRPGQELAAIAGMADGLTVDGEGFVWLAMWGGGGVHRFSPEGDHVGTVAMPVTNVTSCTFGGADGTSLFITTACYGLSDDERARQPDAGKLFVLETPYTGEAARRF